MEYQKALLLTGVSVYLISSAILFLWKNTLTYVEAYQYSVARKSPPIFIITTYLFKLVSVACMGVSGMWYLYNFL